MPFDPKQHTIKIQGGREYLPVAKRLVWFREEHPDWGISTTIVQMNLEGPKEAQFALFTASIFNAEGKLMATATKFENAKGFPDFLEKAETGAVGRALAMCGYGTQFAPELEEGPGRVVDTPPRPLRGAPAPKNVPVSESRDRSDEGTAAAFPPGLRDEDISDPFAEEEESPGPPLCKTCGKTLTPAQATMSIRKYATALCPVHQREAVPV